MRTPILSLVMILHKLFACKASLPEDSDFQESQISSPFAENRPKTTHPPGQKTNKTSQSDLPDFFRPNAACNTNIFSIICQSMQNINFALNFSLGKWRRFFDHREQIWKYDQKILFSQNFSLIIFLTEWASEVIRNMISGPSENGDKAPRVVR